jgi:hypothetical protein
VLRLPVIANIVLPYKSLPIFAAVKAKIRGYKPVLDDPHPGDVSTASLASLEGLVASSSSGSLTTTPTRNWTTTPPRLEWKPP